MIAAATLVDAVLAVLIVETVVLAFASRRILGRTIRDLLPNLAAGLFLLLALRAAVGDLGVTPIAGCLALAGVAHAMDLLRRRG